MYYETIRIVSQDGQHQYDDQGRAITDWHAKQCAWIAKPEFKDATIDWYGEDSDFPAGYNSMEEYERAHPQTASCPDISVTWYWNDKESCIRAFGQPHTFLPFLHANRYNFWDVQTYPYSANRYWGDIMEPKETALERFGKYCKFNEKADRTVVKYNGETLFDGKLN